MTRAVHHSDGVGRVMATDSMDLVIARRLLDHVRSHGFWFRRTAPGPDGPLIGTRQTGEWFDTVYLAGLQPRLLRHPRAALFPARAR